MKFTFNIAGSNLITGKKNILFFTCASKAYEM